MQNDRNAAIDGFLAASGWPGAARRNLADDASFRRYERVELGGRRAVLMDAPPDKEDVRPFVTVSKLLTAQGLSAPEILAEDPQNGFLLLEDLGDDTYTRVLARGGDEYELLQPGDRHADPAAARFPAGGAGAGLQPRQAGRRGGSADRLVLAGGERLTLPGAGPRRLSRIVAERAGPCLRGAVQPGPARLSRRQSDPPAGPDGGGGLRLAGFSGRGDRAGDL